ncbi:hypothetical protein BJY01DRAFT_262080 [Aspergillus pseudoustus]|uniref:Uncharacterized protein n=1 Tax=Aspergillus pseudoustus TaxID=1810923 RepID=A0ABR4IHN5_9EURO
MATPLDINLDRKPYFETSVAALSTIGFCIIGFSVWAILITRFTALHAIPLIASVACAVANGLCYYAFYTPRPKVQKSVASAFADICWPMQELALSFYSYQILCYILPRRSLTILVLQSVEILRESSMYKSPISLLYIGYFIVVAIVETLSAVFLIRFLLDAYRTAPVMLRTRHLFLFLLRSTELRVSSLALIGITRAATYPFQITEQHAVNIPNQIDRLVYIIKCLFPVVLI